MAGAMVGTMVRRSNVCATPTAVEWASATCAAASTVSKLTLGGGLCVAWAALAARVTRGRGEV